MEGGKPWSELLGWDELPDSQAQLSDVTGTVRVRDVFAEHDGDLHRWKVTRRVYVHGGWRDVRLIEVTDDATVRLASLGVDGEVTREVLLGVITCQADIVHLHAVAIDVAYLDEVNWGDFDN